MLGLGSRLSVGIEFGQNRARIAVVSNGAVPTVVACQEVSVPLGDEHRLGQVTAEALAKLEVGKADVHLAFSPAAPAAMRHALFASPRLRSGDLAQVSQRELRKDALANPSSSFVACEPLDLFEEERVPKQANLLVALDKETLTGPAGAVFDAGCVVRSATTSPLALWRLAGVTQAAPEGICAMVLMGARRSFLLVLEQGVPRFLRDIPTTFGRHARENEDETLMAEALARELDISLVYFAQQHRPRHVDTVVVVGDGDLAHSVSDWIEDGGGYNVVRFAASPKLAVGKDAPEDLLPFGVAIGAALGQKNRPVPDLLPSELRSRPERLYALGAASVMLVILVFILLQIRSGTMTELDAAEARLQAARDAYSEIELNLKSASEMDQSAARADLWQSQFDAHDKYHKQLARMLQELPGTVPPNSHLSHLKLAPIDRDPRAALKPDAAHWRLTLEGAVLAADLGGAQTELRRLVRAAEALPTVKAIELKPIKAPLLVGGSVELPFTFDAALVNPFPGKANR